MFNEKFYFEKSKKVFINENNAKVLKQPQKYCIRFIYEMFIKNKPGIILNDETLSSLKEVVLFLNAIKDSLNASILVLTQFVEDFKEVTNELIGDSKDTIYESNKLFGNNKIFVNSVSDLSKFSHQEWSIVILQHTECSAKLFKQLKTIKAKFKIVITYIHIKKDIQAFTKMYDWIYPVNRSYIEEFGTQFKSLRDPLHKAMLLDYFLYDIVFIVKSTNEKYKMKHKQCDKPTNQTRKNKDITGTKIKRSKTNTVINNKMEENNVFKCQETDILINNDNVDDEDNVVFLRKNKNKQIIEDDEDIESINLENDTYYDRINEEANSTINQIDITKEMHVINSIGSLENVSTHTLETSVTKIIIQNSSGSMSTPTQDSDEVIKTSEVNLDDSSDIKLQYSEDESNDDRIENISNNVVLENRTDENKDTVLENVIPETSEADDKLKTLEEQMLKKFKGSILDSLF